MKTFTLFLVLAPLALLATQPKQPNVLFILVDDLGAMDLTNEGSTFYETPNIDRIANEGMKFTRGYATCQVCSPSRASILTGKYPTNHGITQYIGGPSGEAHRKKGRHDSHLPPQYERNLRASEITLAEAMRDAGYKTFFAGKWHLGSRGSWPTDHGFEINKGGWDVGGPRGGFSPPITTPILRTDQMENPLPSGWVRKPQTLSNHKRTANSPFLPTFPFTLCMPPFRPRNPSTRNIGQKQKRWD